MRDEARLTDQTAVVTGGGRGVGHAAAILLAQAGANVVVTARTQSEIEETAEQIKTAGGQALAVPADVSEWASMERLARKTEHAFGPADIVVANASIVDPAGDTWDVDPAEWAQNIQIDLIGAFYSVRAFLPSMVERRSGVLIFVSSGAASHPVPGWSAYCASKAGLNHFARNLASEINQHKLPIRVHTLSPGIVDTSMQEQIRQMPEEDFGQVEKYRRYHEQGELRPPEEPGRFIWWLATPLAADQHNRVVSVDDVRMQRQVTQDLGVPSFQKRSD